MTPHRPKSLGLLLALLALAVQLGFGIALPRANGDAFLAAASICHTDDGRSPPALPHAPDCVLCPLCANVAGSVFVAPSAGPSVPAPRTALIAMASILPQALAPTVPARATARPRAPPLQA
jgi:hypothetical protein